MKEELNRIISNINNHREWNENTKIRYAYIELGKIVHKDYMFFYTIQNNLLNQGKKELQYSINEIDRIMNIDQEFDYSVICKTSAEMLKYIFDNCNIKCEIKKSKEETTYSNENGEVVIRHYFILVTGDNNQNYFLTLNPDLPNIKIGKKTSHFGNRIDYMIEKVLKDENDEKILDEQGNVKTVLVQNYEGDEVQYTVMSQEEIKRIDREIGYIDESITENGEYDYTDSLFNMLKKAYYLNNEYLSIVSSQTQFYYDLTRIINRDGTFEEIIQEESRVAEEELKNTCLNFNINKMSEDDWNDVKRFIILNTVLRLHSAYNLRIDNNMLKGYLEDLENANYNLIFEKFKTELFKDENNKRKVNELKGNNPLLKVRQAIALIKVIDSFSTKKYHSDQEFKELKKKFAEGIYNISIMFVPNKYLPEGNSLSSSYLTHKILTSFNNIFDIGHHIDFNDLELAEQIEIIKEILNIVLQDVKVEPKLPNYDENKTPIKNRLLTTAIFDKKTNKPYYLICVKNIISEKETGVGISPILYDLKNNILITDKSMVEIYNNYYIIKDADMKFMIEEMSSTTQSKH